SKSSRVLGMEGRWLEGRKVGRSERRRDGKSRVRKRRPLSRSAVLIPYLPLSDFPTFRLSDFPTFRLLHDLLVALRVPLGPLGGIADFLAQVEDQLENAGFLLRVDLVRRV